MELSSLLLTLWLATTSLDCAAYRRVCYYTNWAQYRSGQGRFTPADIPADLCTHLVYAFASMDGNRLKPVEWNDDSFPWAKGMYESFNEIKMDHPSVTTLLAVGGWNFGTHKMSAMLRTLPSRTEFVRTTVHFLRNRTFDGLDLDFEYPGSRGSPPEDKELFAQLVKELHFAFEDEAVQTGRRRLLLSAAVAAGIETVKTGYDVATLTQYLDFISVMTYDFHGKWEKTAGHGAPLFAHSLEHGPDTALNLAFAVNFWLELGAEPAKLNIGVPFYGRTFTLRDESENWVGAAAVGGGKAGPYTGEEGMLSFYEICEFVKRGAEVFWIEDQGAPYAVLGAQWVSFDDERSLRNKVRWMKLNGLGGVMVWALDLDDFKGQCNGRPFPLLQAINEELRSDRPTAEDAAMMMSRSQNTVLRQRFQAMPTRQRTTLDNGATTMHNVKQFCSGRLDGFFVESRDCSRYLECHGGLSRNLLCPVGTYFNGTFGACMTGRRDQCVGTRHNEIPLEANQLQDTALPSYPPPNPPIPGFVSSGEGILFD